MRRLPLHRRIHERGALFVSVLSLALMLAARPAEDAAAAERDPLQGDARLQRTLTVRVSRMPVTELLQRVSEAVGVGLAAEGEDVGDQKVDLFTHGSPVSAAQVLSAVPRLLNAESPPRGYFWIRSGEASRFRYTLVRDVASRQWETRQAAEAETHLPRLLRERFAALAREPFRPEAAAKLELSSMRKLLVTLSDAQLSRLCAERYLSLTAADCSPAQKELLGRMVDELVQYQLHRWPEQTQAMLARAHPLESQWEDDMEVVLQGEAPRYMVRVGVVGPAGLGQASDLCPVEDPASLAGDSTGSGRNTAVLPRDISDPVFALPPRSSWLMGDVLADIAARAKINLIADDYTQRWQKLSRYSGARPLSQWLAAIRNEYGFVPGRDGSFARLRNRVWWLDQPREIPPRLLARWREQLRGTNADRLRVLVDMAHRVPFSSHPRVISDRMRVLEVSPEMAWTVNQNGPRTVLSLTGIVAIRQLELLLYDQLTPAQQQAVLGAGLTIPWSDTPPEWRRLWLRGLRSSLDAEDSRSLTLFLRYSGGRLEMDRDMPAASTRDNLEAFLPPEPANDPRQLVGRLLPELQVEATPGKVEPFRTRGPMLLYVTPAWPRPVVAERESFDDLRALEKISGAHVQVLGTEATTAELREWGKERGLATPPPALQPESAQALGMGHQPLAIVVDRNSRVTWVKEGYTPGDEAEWRQQMEHAGG